MRGNFNRNLIKRLSCDFNGIFKEIKNIFFKVFIFRNSHGCNSDYVMVVVISLVKKKSKSFSTRIKSWPFCLTRRVLHM